MQLITADWLLPVSRPPIRNGAVLTAHGLVVEIGRVEELAKPGVDMARRDFPGCVLTPGLVNAHTHLSLTSLEGLIEPQPFERWLSLLVAAIREWEVDDHAASAALGALKCLQSGVTVVGDITYGPEAPSVALGAGLGGTFFWEVLGFDSPRLYAELERMEYPAADHGDCGPRMRCGLSPHAPYTSGPRLLKAVHAAATEIGVPLATHVAESAAEVELLRHGTGPLADVAERFAAGFEPPGVGPVAYLDRLGVLDGTTVIHAGHAGPTDIVRLAATARGVVACPRSNAFLSNPVAPVSRLLRTGVPVGLGTDSSASNHSLDLMEEVRALHAHDPAIPPRILIEMATLMGAICLGLESRFGILEPGMQADIAVFDIGDTLEPEDDFVRLGGTDTLRAVLADGVWRILDGQPVDAVERVVSAARAAQIRAEQTLARL